MKKKKIKCRWCKKGIIGERNSSHGIIINVDVKRKYAGKNI